MASDMTSMLKAILEAQQREMAWDPTSDHSFESSSTYQEGLPNEYSSQEYQYGDEYPTQEYQDEYGGYLPQEYQYGYGDGYMEHEQEYQEYQSWNMEHEATYSSQNSVEEESLQDMLKLVLKRQEEFNESMKMKCTNFCAWSHDAQISKPTHEVNARTQDESLQEAFPQEDSLQEVEEMLEILEEFEQKHGTLYPSQISIEEEDYNMSKLILEEQEKFNESLRKYDTNLDAGTQSSRFVETTHVESIKSELTQWIDEGEEDSLQEAFLQEDSSQEAKEIVEKFELLLGCTIGEDLVIGYGEEGKVEETFEDPCEDGLCVECIDTARESTTQNELSNIEEMHKQPDSKQESYGEKSMEEHEIIIEETSKGNEEEESPLTQQFDNHLGILSTTPLRFHSPRKSPFEKNWMKEFRDLFNDTPRKIPFEEIRMKEFRGWFYDEYDPGDPSSTLTPT